MYLTGTRNSNNRSISPIGNVPVNSNGALNRFTGKDNTVQRIIQYCFQISYGSNIELIVFPDIFSSYVGNAPPINTSLESHDLHIEMQSMQLPKSDLHQLRLSVSFPTIYYISCNCWEQQMIAENPRMLSILHLCLSCSKLFF